MSQSAASNKPAGRQHQFNRWLYRGGRLNRLAQVVNRISAKLFSTGWIMPNRLATLEVPGRRTGRIISFPVVVAHHDGDRYLVSMLGTDSNWPRNVRAAGGHAVLRHGWHEAIRLTEIEPGARAPVLRSYLAVAPGARSHVPLDPRAPLEEFDVIAARYPVFRITTDVPDAPKPGEATG